MKNTFYFTLKGHLVLETLEFLIRIFGHVEKRPGISEIIDNQTIKTLVS